MPAPLVERGSVWLSSSTPDSGPGGRKGEICPDDNGFLAVPAKERFDRDSEYRPAELERYLAGQDRIRLEPVLPPGLSAGLPPLPPAPSGTQAAADAHKGTHRTT